MTPSAARARLWLVTATLAVGCVLPACGGRGSWEGRSAHFTVHAHEGAVAPDDMLARLEADYRDLRAFLGFAPTVIDYHLYASPEALAVPCASDDGAQAVGCARGTVVHTTSPLHHHELIHAYLAAVGVPPPLVSEGIAEGVACDRSAVPANVEVGWDRVIAEPALNRNAVHTAGMALFVYLTRTFGVDRFVAFYAATGDTHDPGAFAAHFQSFWGVSIDDAWRDMQVARSPGGRLHALCPCTQPAAPLDGSTVDFGARDTAVVPLGEGAEAAAQPMLITTAGGATLSNCAQDYLSFTLADDAAPAGQGITAARLLPERHYVGAGAQGAVSAQTGAFVAPVCDEAVPIAVPPDYAGTISLVVARGAGEPAGTDWYARFQFEDGRRLLSGMRTTGAETVLVCPSCAAARDAMDECVVAEAGRGAAFTIPGNEAVLRTRPTAASETVASTSLDVIPQYPP